MITYVRLDKKTVDWRINPFPEENPFDVKVQSLEADEVIQLYNYRYKAEGTPKAVIIMFHGYESYTYGYYAKYFAEKGYDFVGFDFRGFGKLKVKGVILIHGNNISKTVGLTMILLEAIMMLQFLLLDEDTH